MIQQLFPQDDDAPKQGKHDANYLLRHGHGRKLHPVTSNLRLRGNDAPNDHQPANGDHAALSLIRNKVQSLYAQEPSAAEEIRTTAVPEPQRSKHQQFMYDLSTSGKSLAQIQTEWHNYYVALPDDQKHEVWRDFYAANNRQPSAYTQATVHHPAQHSQPPLPQLPALPPTRSKKAEAIVSVAQELVPVPRGARGSKSRLKKRILKHVKVSASSQAKAKQHFHSLLFGLGTGAVVLALFFFGLFNEMIIAPFIQPSRHVSATPIIVDSDSVAPSETPEVIIPKINVQLPVVYDEPSMEEKAIQSALERGVVHYPTTVLPGQQGNAAIFGHSSNNIFNKGKYKFAFAMLRQLVPGDVFYLTYDKKIYSYRVFEKRVVTPTEVSVLGAVAGKVATAALITCDPPGTSTNRLVVWGEQISPDPAAATAPVTPPTTGTPQTLPSEGPKLWNRLWNAIF